MDTCQRQRNISGSPNTATSVNDNEIYLNVIGGPNYKGNVYYLGTLSKRFSCSKSTPSISITLMEDQIEKMRETITKLNAKLLEKTNKERILESIMSAPSPLTTTVDETDHYVDDAQVDRSHYMSKDH
ncbi:hypothetical protein HKD37_19G053196 [Glycine soja]